MTRRDCRPVSLRQASDLLQSMGHPIRLQVLEALRGSELPVTDIVERLKLPQPVVSRHLAILRRASIVSCRPSGRERVYRIADCPARSLLDVLFPTSPNHNPSQKAGAAA